MDNLDLEMVSVWFSLVPPSVQTHVTTASIENKLHDFMKLKKKKKKKIFYHLQIYH